MRFPLADGGVVVARVGDVLKVQDEVDENKSTIEKPYSDAAAAKAAAMILGGEGKQVSNSHQHFAPRLTIASDHRPCSTVGLISKV